MNTNQKLLIGFALFTVLFLAIISLGGLTLNAIAENIVEILFGYVYVYSVIVVWGAYRKGRNSNILMVAVGVGFLLIGKIFDIYFHTIGFIPADARTITDIIRLVGIVLFLFGLWRAIK
ncbi:MAG: hypothetical protein ABID38_02755 [Candidatus Diapherotrites archaeon]